MTDIESGWCLLAGHDYGWALSDELPFRAPARAEGGRLGAW